MTETGRQRDRIRASSPVATVAVLAACSAIAFGCGWSDPERIRAIVFAATVCFAGAAGAWFVGLWPADTPSARVTAGLGTVALRIFPALVALGWLQAGGGDLRAAGAGELLVIFYLAALAAEVIRTIMTQGQSGRRADDSTLI